MFSDPEWATSEEWDAYAWFGFAMAEAQAVEAHLQVIAAALDLASRESAEPTWTRLYDECGALTLGQLTGRVRRFRALSPDLMRDLDLATETRNRLAHGFFWQRTTAGQDLPVARARERLMAAASLFRSVSLRLGCEVELVLEHMHVERAAAEREAADRSGREATEERR